MNQFPPELKGTCLHHNQTQSKRNEILLDVAKGKFNVLLLSPEALQGGSFWSRRGNSLLLGRLPPVAFACIDEVHCVSEWSHNFRPSYFRISKVNTFIIKYNIFYCNYYACTHPMQLLKERLGVHCVLGLTATATQATADSVAARFNIESENIINDENIIPKNLSISVSCDQDRNKVT